MFKKIQDWLFKEDMDDLDIEEKDELDEYSLEEEFKATHEEPKKKVLFERSQPQVEKVSEPSFFEQPTPAVETVKPKITIDITADDNSVNTEVKQPPVSKPRTTLTRKDEFEMAPVISPYFGVKGEIKDDVHVSLNTITHTSKKESFNSVISPFYGEKETKKEIRQTLHSEESTNHLDARINASAFETSDKNVFVEDEEENISLDAIVSAPNTNDDDLIQFSLFGEAKKIQEEEFENENSEENDNVELPF